LLKEHLDLLSCGRVQKVQENCTSALPVSAGIERRAGGQSSLP